MGDTRAPEHAGGPQCSLESLEVTIDAVDIHTVARFWEVALGYEQLYERPPYLVLGPAAGSGPRASSGPRLVIQQVGAVSGDKVRVHLDLRVRDPAIEVRRLQALGAAVREVVTEAGTSWTVMSDPEGTPFCVCEARLA